MTDGVTNAIGSDSSSSSDATVTITLSNSASGVTVTAYRASSGTTTTGTTTSSGVTLSLSAGTWTFSADGYSDVSEIIVGGTSYSIVLTYNPPVYGFSISISTSDPASRVTYPETIFGYKNFAYGFTPVTNSSGTFSMGSWSSVTDDFIAGIKRQTGNATSGWTDVSSKTSATAGSSGGTDVMVYFPTWYLRMENDGTQINVAFSESQLDSNWKDYAGSVGTNRVGHFRLGAFLTSSSSAVYSYGGSSPSGITLTNAITYTQTNRGTGYDLMTWYMYEYIAALMVLMFKTTNLQAALGNGVQGQSSVVSQAALSYTNDYGMYGSTSVSTSQMAFFWLQNIYGNYWQWVGGAHTDSRRRLETNTGYSSTSTWDKTALTSALSSNLDGAINKVSGTTDTGFFPQSTGGSYTTYFADYGYVYASYFPFVGGYYGDSTGYGGPFYARFYYSTSGTYGVRLAYRL